MSVVGVRESTGNRLPALVAPDASTAKNLLFLLILPFPLWGASLALATAAYNYRRRTTCPACRQA